MRNFISSNKSWLLLGILLLIFITISYFMNSDQAKEFPSYVSDSPAPTGTKAIYTYLDNHMEVERWSHSPNLLLNGEANQLLIMIEPSFIPESGAMEQYIQFMEAGNTILLFHNDPHGMFAIETNLGMANYNETVHVEDKDGVEYKAIHSSMVRLQDNDEEQVLLSDNSGIVAMKRDFDHGKLIVANNPIWITNDQILAEDHLELLHYLFTEAGQNWSRVLFDEYIHGAENTPPLTILYPQWMLVLGLQLLLLTVLWLWYKGKRFGPILISREESVRFSDERIRALAAWYQRGKRYRESLEIQADYVKLLLQERWGISYRKHWLDIGDSLTWRWNKDSKEINAFVKGLTRTLRKQGLSKQEYLHWSKKIDQLREEVEE